MCTFYSAIRLNLAEFVQALDAEEAEAAAK